jgi:hypothetical protein
MKNEDIYKELCTSYRAIDDFRQKLLSFLPLASGGILAFLGGATADKFNPLLSCVGLLGFLVTLGLFFFEIYGIRKCTYLIFVGAYLEWKAEMEHGQFMDRPPPLLGFIAEPMAAGVIYPAVMAAWIYMAMYFSNGDVTWIGFFVAFIVFLISAGFMGWYQVRLKEEQKCWEKRAVMPEPVTATAGCADNPKCADEPSGGKS